MCLLELLVCKILNRSLHANIASARIIVSLKLYQHPSIPLLIEKFIGNLKNAPWGKVYTEDSVKESYKNFETIVKDIVVKHAPRIQKKIRGTHCPFRTPEICELIKIRDYHLRKAKKSRNDNDWYNYKKYRKKVTASIRKSKAQYNQNVIEENVRNPKQFWKILKTLYPQGNTSQINSKVFEIDGKMEDNEEKIADGFCKAFTTCAKKLCSLLASCFTWQNDGEIEKAQTRFLFKHVTKQKVLRHLQGLKSNKAPGHDDVPVRLLKDASYVLAGPLSNIINKSLK